MFEYVDYQKQRKQREGIGLHTGFIPTTSRRRRKFRRTEKTDIGLCPIQGHEEKTWKMSRHTQGGPLATYASPSVPLYTDLIVPCSSVREQVVEGIQ